MAEIYRITNMECNKTKFAKLTPSQAAFLDWLFHEEFLDSKVFYKPEEPPQVVEFPER